MDNIESMSETVTVKAIDGKTLVIERNNPGACNGCRANLFCNMQNKSEITLETEDTFEIGDEVELLVSPQSRILSSFIVYIVPLLVLVIFYFISFELFNFSEIVSIVISFISLIVSFFIIKLFNKRFDNTNVIQIMRK